MIARASARAAGERMKTKYQVSIYDEIQRRRDYMAAIDRALPDDDDQESFET